MTSGFTGVGTASGRVRTISGDPGVGHPSFQAMETLERWLPHVVDQIVVRFRPVRVILFGSVARGEEGPDSDLDLMVVFDHLEPGQRRDLTAQIMRAVRAPVPYDVFVTDVVEFEAKKDVNGTMAYWPAHEGVVVHERAVA